MMPSKVVVKTNESKPLPKQVSIRVGCLGPDEFHPTAPGEKPFGGMTIKGLFETHEFGLGNVPERSMVRGGYDLYHEQIEQLFLQQMQANPNEPELVAERVAVKAAALFRNRVTDGLSPELAKSTIKSKERRGIKPPYKPLIETGLLRSSIVGDFEVIPGKPGKPGIP